MNVTGFSPNTFTDCTLSGQFLPFSPEKLTLRRSLPGFQVMTCRVTVVTSSSPPPGVFRSHPGRGCADALHPAPEDPSSECRGTSDPPASACRPRCGWEGSAPSTRIVASRRTGDSPAVTSWSAPPFSDVAGSGFSHRSRRRPPPDRVPGMMWKAALKRMSRSIVVALVVMRTTS